MVGVRGKQFSVIKTLQNIPETSILISKRNPENTTKSRGAGTGSHKEDGPRPHSF